MRSPSLLIAILILVGLALLAWSPWITPRAAERIATQRFEAAWAGVIDGCGFNCDGCGATALDRLPFLQPVQLEFACGLIPADLPEYHVRDVVYISPLGSIHSLDRP
jgi:hypothetical protein